MTGAEAHAQGYRRVSNRYNLVARIDRPDWLQFMAKSLHRAPADFYVPGEEHPAGNWCDYYRRVHSKDTLTLPRDEYLKVGGSSGDPIGYVERLPQGAVDGRQD